jgi:hypothetical protein
MQGFLKAATTILKCTHPYCRCLRDVSEVGTPCVSCLTRGVLWRWTVTLPLADISDDCGATNPIENFLAALTCRPDSYEDR